MYYNEQNEGKLVDPLKVLHPVRKFSLLHLTMKKFNSQKIPTLPGVFRI